jgi:hypothetical protein
MTTTIQLNNGTPVKWGSQPITWSLATSNLPDQNDGVRTPTPYTSFATAPDAANVYTMLIQQAVAVWEKVANVKFQQVADSDAADIRIGFGDLLPSAIGKYWAEYDTKTNFYSPGTVVQIESALHTPVVATPDGPGWSGGDTTVVQDLIAQIGHAIGLVSSTDDPNSIAAGTLGTNNRIPDPGDVTAIQAIYGPPTATTPLVTPSTTPLVTAAAIPEADAGASVLVNLGNATKDFLDTQVMGSVFHLRAGEIEVPSSSYAHNGDTQGNSWVLLHNDSNFQLFRADKPGLAFIYSNNNNASFFADHDMKIYDFGQNNTLRFSDEQGHVEVFGFEHDVTGSLVIYNATDQSVVPDGRGGTLVGGNIDVHDVTLDSSRVCFKQVDTDFATHQGLVQLV